MSTSKTEPGPIRMFPFVSNDSEDKATHALDTDIDEVVEAEILE